MKTAEELGDNGRYIEAIKVLDKIIEDNPDYLRAYNYKASYLSLSPETYSDALKTIDQALAIDSNCAGCYFTRGLISNGESAISDLTRAIEIHDGDPEGYYVRAQKFRLNGNFLEAIKDFNKAIVLNPEIVKLEPILSEKAGCWLELMEYDSTINTLTKALKYDSTDYHVYIMRSMYYLKSQMDITKAKEDFLRSKQLGLDSLSAESCEKLFEEIESQNNSNLMLRKHWL